MVKTMKRLNRILDNKDFQKLIKSNQSFSNKSFVVFYQKNNLKRTRVGISIGVKIGGAVMRNKVKRQIRMMSYQLLNLATPIDIVIMVRSGYQKLDYKTNKEELAKLFKKINEVD